MRPEKLSTAVKASLFVSLAAAAVQVNVLPLRAQAVQALSQPSSRLFDVRQFGAVGDGKTLDTAALQKAFDECGKAGGGIVRVSAGTYLSKPLVLHSSTTLQLDEGATLQATDSFDDFNDPKKPGAVVAFLSGNTLSNVTIMGKGRIDGAGAKWWEPAKAAKKAGTPEPRRRPRLVVISNCVGLRVRDITLQNSPSFHLVPSDCEDVIIEGVTIKAPADSPNTDAIDPSACRHVTISKCVIDVGDDNIAIKSGHPDEKHPNAACESITVTGCTFLYGHGMSIGSETVGGVRGLRVSNCTFENTTSGIRIKSDRTKGGTVEDCVYSDITMKNVQIPINVTTYYPKVPAQDVAQPMSARTPIYRNLRISNLTASSPRSAGFLVGLPECAISNVVVENVHISAPKGLVVRHTQGLELRNSGIQVEKGEPLVLQEGAGRVVKVGDK